MPLKNAAFAALFFCVSNSYSQPLKQADSLKDAKKYLAAIKVYAAVLKNNRSITLLDSGNTFLRRGICYYGSNNPSSALEDYFRALAVFEKLDNPERIAAARYNLSIVFLAQQNFKEAENCLARAGELYASLKDTARLSLVFNDLACVYRETGRYAPAIELHNKAINEFSERMDEALLAKHFYNKGNCFEKSNGDSCIFYYQKAESIAIDIDDSSMIGAINISLGDVYKGKNDYSKALLSFEKALTMNYSYGSREELNAIYANLADLYDSLKIYDKAYYYSKKERELNDELYNIKKSKFATELSEKYESGKKDEKIKSQDTENKLKSRNLLLSLIGLGLAAALAAISFINYRRKQKANTVLQLQNDRIEKLNKELDASNQVKSKLFSVISHDIRGPISSIYAYLQLQQAREKNDSSSTFSEQTAQLLDTLEDLLVWSKSQLHQFAPTSEAFYLRPVVDQITGLLQGNIYERKLQIENEVSPALVLQTDLNMLTIILRNILSNAVKYAATGSAIKVSVHQTGSAFNIVISNKTDNTFAFHTETNAISSNASGLGITLIKEFTEKIGGTIVYTTKDDEVTATISLPI